MDSKIKVKAREDALAALKDMKEMAEAAIGEASREGHRGFLGRTYVEKIRKDLLDYLDAQEAAVAGVDPHRHQVHQHDVGGTMRAKATNGEVVLVDRYYPDKEMSMRRLLESVHPGDEVTLTVTVKRRLSEDGVNTQASVDAFVEAIQDPRFRHISRRSWSAAGDDRLCVYFIDTDSPTGCKLATAVVATSYTEGLVAEHKRRICAGGCMGNARMS